MRFVNLTPHDIVLNNGTTFASEGNARVASNHSAFDENGICNIVFGEITGLPDPVENTMFIVSAMVKSASERNDLVSPATGHPDTIRNEKGHIVSVPGFVYRS